MSTAEASQVSGPGGQGPRIRMCRGCCCGTVLKHPHVDHDTIADVLEHTAGPHVEVLRVDCLWACDLSNVVVVNPSAQARREGARPAWLAKVNTVERARAVAEWVHRGGPGIAEPSEELGEVLVAAGLRRISMTRE